MKKLTFFIVFLLTISFVSGLDIGENVTLHPSSTNAYYIFNDNVSFNWINITPTKFENSINNLSFNPGTSTNYYLHGINVSVYSAITNFTVNQFTLSFNNVGGVSYGGTLNTNSGHQHFLAVNDSTLYNISISASGFATQYFNVTPEQFNNDEYNISVNTYNSIIMNIYNGSTGERFNKTVTITTSGEDYEYINTTNETGYFYLDELALGLYTVTFSADNYSSATYVTTVTNYSTQTINAYLFENSGTVIFTVKDKENNQLIENVNVVLQRSVNSTWTTVEVKQTDVTGKASFGYTSGVYYKFILTHSNYQTKEFDLTPILYSTYTILMDKSITYVDTSDYSAVSIDYSPKMFYEGRDNNFTFIIKSGSIPLLFYGLNITYPGGFINLSSTNSDGYTFITSVNITNATLYDRATLTYYYTRQGDSKKTFVAYLPIIVNSSDFTWVNNQERDYGLGLFERIFIVTLLVIVVFALVAMGSGNPLIGGLAALLMFAFFIKIGLVSIWVAFISMTVGFIIIAWRSNVL